MSKERIWEPGMVCLNCPKCGEYDIHVRGKYSGVTFCSVECMMASEKWIQDHLEDG